MKKTILIIAFVAMLLPFGGCKPTEKGYKEAYDIAKKKEREGLDDETFEKMNEAALPAKVQIEGVEMRRTADFLSAVYPEDVAQNMQLQRFNPCVGVYKMVFNAKSHVDRLREEGMPALLLKGPGNKYYACIGTYSTEEAAASATGKYLKNHVGQFVGLDMPLLLIAAR